MKICNLSFIHVLSNLRFKMRKIYWESSFSDSNPSWNRSEGTNDGKRSFLLFDRSEIGISWVVQKWSPIKVFGECLWFKLRIEKFLRHRKAFWNFSKFYFHILRTEKHRFFISDRYGSFIKNVFDNEVGNRLWNKWDCYSILLVLISPI